VDLEVVVEAVIMVVAVVEEVAVVLICPISRR
jgi:hypothetical protein